MVTGERCLLSAEGDSVERTVRGKEARRKVVRKCSHAVKITTGIYNNMHMYNYSSGITHAVKVTIILR